MPAVLTLLRIKNLALAEELEWLTGPGFVAVTGETGAGKSIIIGALQLLLGERADLKYAATVSLMLARRRARVAGLD
jgi:DNA repair ATPase RecN